MKLHNTIFALCALGLAIAPVAAQDLDTTSITDQFNTGTRGNAVSTGATFGNSLTDGTEFLDYSGADSTGGAIRYINSFTNSASGAGDTAFGESPVLDVTSATAGQGVGNPDRNLLPGTAIIANTRPGATGATTAVLTSDDGGTNCLHFGESDDANYFVEVDVFCYDQSAVAGNSWVFVALRSADNDPTANAGSFTVDRESSYALVYDYNTLDVKLIYFPNDNGAYTSAGPNGTTLGTSAVLTGNAWHTLRISALGTTITGSVDGTQFASVTDTNVTNGRASIGFRDGGAADATATTDERAGTFDNLKAGPTASPVGNWVSYN